MSEPHSGWGAQWGNLTRGDGEEGKHSIFITTPAKKYAIVKCNIDNIDNIEADNDGTWLSMTPENECYVSRKGGSDEGLLAVDFTHCTHSTRTLPILFLPGQGENFWAKSLIKLNAVGCLF